METKRRDFLVGVAAALAARVMTARGGTQGSSEASGDEWTVQQVIDRILRDIPGSPPENTVDTLKVGDPLERVTGVATTFLATCDVIERAHALGANLIIPHEPLFFNHRDEVEWLTEDPVYGHKLSLLNRHRMAVWRFHDYWHRVTPDPVNAALIGDLGLEEVEQGKDNRLCRIEPTSLEELALSFKKNLGLTSVRVIGDPSLVCRRVGILPGAWGGTPQMGLLAKERVDVLVCGEISEWETSIYVKDSIAAGLKTSLIILGHVQSEEPGMRILVPWLKERLPGLPVHHVPMGDPFFYV